MFAITLGSTSGVGSAVINASVAVLQDAADYWGRYIDFGGSTLTIELSFASQGNSSLAEGGGPFFFTRVVNGINVFEPGSVRELRTGVDPNGSGADITIEINSDAANDGDFFFGGIDQPNVPFGQFDLFTVLVHEIGHGLGVLGFGDDGTDIAEFDLFVQGSGANLVFTGSNASAVFGGDVPLAFADPSHFAGFFDVLNASLDSGRRRVISDVDVAVLRDIGLAILDPTNGDDTLFGFESEFDGRTYANGNDFISLLAGNDTFEAFSGDDTVSGGDGFDSILGGAGNDELLGGDQNDTLEGGAGNDLLAGNEGDDTLIGGAGADILSGAQGTDTVIYAASTAAVNVDLSSNVASGGDAAGDTFISINNLVGSAFGDRLVGEAGRNLIQGGSGVDTLFGVGGDDTLEGGSSGDELWGGEGRDLLIGEGGDDLYAGNEGDDTLVGGPGADTLSGAQGRDTVTYESSASAVNANLGGVGAAGDAAGDTYVSIEIVFGTSFNDTLVGDDLNNIFVGGNGADRLEGGNGADELLGNDGADIIFGDGGNDTVAGNVGDDTLIGGAGADIVSGAQGIDTASYETSSGAVSVNLGAGTATGADAQGDTFFSIEIYLGSAFNDTLVGDDLANIFAGLGGADRLEGAGGNDELNGNDGDDLILGGAGADLLAGNMGDDTLIGGAGGDTLSGAQGADTASYETSASGVNVNLGANTASGGDAAGDTFISVANLIGSLGNDALTGDGGSNELQGFGGQDQVDGAGGADTVFGGDGNDLLLGGTGDDLLGGNVGNDTLIGGAGADTLSGAQGADTASYAGSGSGVSVNLNTGSASGGDAAGDTFISIANLIGSSLGDILSGDGLANRLDGAAGDDSLTGLGGGDTFVFALNNDNDTITDFDTASGDVVLIQSFGASFDTFAEVIAAASQSGGDVVINFGGGDTLTLSSVTLGALSADDFLFG